MRRPCGNVIRATAAKARRPIRAIAKATRCITSASSTNSASAATRPRMPKPTASAERRSPVANVTNREPERRERSVTNQEGELARAGIKNSVLAVGCLLIVAAFVGLRPSRADEFNLPEPQRAARQTGPPRFPHKQEKHRTVDCATCHLGAKRNATASDHPVAKDFPHA